MLYKNNNWMLAADSMHFDKPSVAGVDPGIAFDEEMIAGNKNIKIGLIPCAWCGSPISVWEPDSANLTCHPYGDAIAMRSGVLKGILWQQGEVTIIYKALKCTWIN